ncbi:hypothetical protein MVEN_02237800 [Mycena venus]|uniref:C2H2-type domain-containing protein n=1 Tax=Mycena venus TaxID=2733690 RepID=A0A8H7CHP1_9AGAR|nr:hypothetical protein MVEN_02237800 [Mycena venus]
MRVVHPMERCACGRQIFVDELQHHYTQSVQHPSCVRCNIGFKDDEEYNKHGAAEHPESRCTPCCRQFTTTAELADHLHASPEHPTCPKCKSSFMDDGSLNEHLAIEHTPREIPPFKDLLAIEGPPVISRPAKSSLPPPGREANELWKLTKNQVVGPTLDPWMATALIRPAAGPPHAGRDIESPNSRVFERTKAAATGEQLAFRPSDEKPIKSDQTGLWMRLSNKTMVGSTDAPNDSKKTISPQSSTSSFSSSFAELSSASSVANSGIRPDLTVCPLD